MQKLDIDYGWQKPEIYMVFVPGLSLVIQKMQMAKVLPLTPNKERNSSDVAANDKAKKFIDICKWHLRGSITQVLVCTVAVKVFALPVFSLIALVSLYEMSDTFARAYKSGSICVYTYRGDSPPDIEYRSAINIF